MSEETANRLVAFVILVALVAALSAVLGWGCRAEPPPPPPSPPTVAPRPSATTTPATMTPAATSTAQPTNPPATWTPTPAIPVAPTAAPTASPTVALRGIHVVEWGDTLWGVACAWYADMPLLPGANPLTPCTCWPGIYEAGPRIRPPQLIYPGERLAIPAACGQEGY